ncbi:TFIID-18kDa-domain-containing protein [Meredithblackwellia eburnea MCA 4105]
MAPNDVRDREAAQRGTRKILKKGLFAKDLQSMMYGFGDDVYPAQDSITMMEELLIDHITDVCLQAQRVSTNRGKIKVDDFKFALRHDPKKLARVDELLFMQEVIARARGKDEFTQYAEEEQQAQAQQQHQLALAAATSASASAAGVGKKTAASTAAPTPAAMPVEPKSKGKSKAKKQA